MSPSPATISSSRSSGCDRRGSTFCRSRRTTTTTSRRASTLEAETMDRLRALDILYDEDERGRYFQALHPGLRRAVLLRGGSAHRLRRVRSAQRPDPARRPDPPGARPDDAARIGRTVRGRARTRGKNQCRSSGSTKFRSMSRRPEIRTDRRLSSPIPSAPTSACGSPSCRTCLPASATSATTSAATASATAYPDPGGSRTSQTTWPASWTGSGCAARLWSASRSAG